MTEFNQFTTAFDDAVKRKDVEAATATVVDYVQEHSKETGKELQESFNIVRAWMGYDMGGNREAHTRNTPDGQQALSRAVAKLGVKAPGT